MLALLKAISPSMWIIIGLSVALLATSVAVKVQSGRLADCKASVLELETSISVQNDKVARWEREAERQKALVAQSASEARSAARRWQALIDRAENERPAVKPSDGPLAVCKGSMRWLIDQGNGLSKLWNSAN